MWLEICQRASIGKIFFYNATDATKIPLRENP